MKRLLLVTLLSLLLPLTLLYAKEKKEKADASAGGGNAEKQVAALADQFTQAFEKADTGFMEKYFADEYTGIHSDGKLSTKAQEIDNVKSGNLKWASVDVHDRKIHVYGDTALVTGLSSSTGTIGGKPYSGDYRTTQVWVKQKGDWKVVALQSTRVATPSQ
jgi:ketosteroid isomerase-like protein